MSICSIDDIDLFNDIESLITLINACDIVVTISNVTAHIAGAMGKEVLLLLPFSDGKFWYWQDHNGVSLWYPTVRCFKQQRSGSWFEPISELRQYLESQIA